MKNLDTSDIEILKLLQNNSNITTKELSEKIHLSSTPIYERVKKMEKEGYIKKYVAILDAEKLDKELIVFLQYHLKTTHQKNWKPICKRYSFN